MHGRHAPFARCKGLQLGAVAEGMENRDPLESLHKPGCRVMQRFFISRPVSAEQVITLPDRDWLQEFNRA